MLTKCVLFSLDIAVQVVLKHGTAKVQTLNALLKTLLQKEFLGAGKNIFLGAMSLLLAAKNQLLTSLQIGVLTTYLMPRTYPLLHHIT